MREGAAGAVFTFALKAQAETCRLLHLQDFRLCSSVVVIIAVIVVIEVIIVVIVALVVLVNETCRLLNPRIFASAARYV